MNINRLNRREFGSALAASGLALSLGRYGEGAPLVVHSPNLATNGGFTEEGARLTQLCLSYFWDNTSHMFRAPVLSAETVPSDALHDRGYTFWPSLLALHALIEGEKLNAGRYAS